MPKREYVLIRDVAAKIGINRSVLLRWLKQNGFQDKLFDVRTKATRGSAAKAISPAGERAIIAAREKQGW